VFLAALDVYKRHVYHITDTDWYVTAISTTVATIESLHLFLNRDSIPSGIQPKVVYVDTGYCMLDLVSSPIELPLLPNYYPVQLLFTSNTEITDFVLKEIVSAKILISLAVLDGEGVMNIPVDTELVITPSQLSFSASAIDTITDKYRLVFKFERYVPVDVPTSEIDSVSATAENRIIILFSSPVDNATDVLFYTVKYDDVEKNISLVEKIDTMEYRLTMDTPMVDGVTVEVTLDSVITNIWGGQITNLVNQFTYES